MTDEELIARLLKWAEILSKEPVMTSAADRIEELKLELDELGRKLNTARYGQPDFAWSIHEKEMADLRAKLTKAVEALRNILKGDYNWSMAREVLAELEGK